MAVAHLQLGGGVGGAPGLVQDCVVEAGVTPSPRVFLRETQVFLIIIWTIRKDVCSCLTRDISQQFDSVNRAHVNVFHSIWSKECRFIDWPTSFWALFWRLVWCVCERRWKVTHSVADVPTWRQIVRVLNRGYLSQSVLLQLKCCLFTPQTLHLLQHSM